MKLDFGGTTQLQRAVLMKDYTEVKSLLHCNQVSALFERNFLGQTALHLAVQNPKMLGCLIENGFSNSIDAEDRNGTTPLMHAAAYNQGDSVMLLIDSGAKPNPVDNLNGLNFLGYVIFRNNYDILRKLVDECRRVGDTDSVNSIIDFCLWRYMISNNFRRVDIQMKDLQFLLQAAENLRITSKRGNTLLHFACNRYEADALLNKTGCPVDQQNHRGCTPFMVLLRLGEPKLIRRVVSEGALVNKVDNNAMSALINHIRPGSWLRVDTHRWRDHIDTIAALLASGADVLQGDSRLCACSAFGCTPTSLLYTCRSYFNRGVTLSNIPWLLEWYILLKHLRPPEILHQALAALFRFQEFEELGITHTCCAKHKMANWFFDVNFHYPADDEISGVVAEPVSNTTEDDVHEILEEEEEYIELLELACSDFEKLSEKSDEEKRISILSRRAVFIEEGNRKIIEKNALRQRPLTRPFNLDELKVCLFPVYGVTCLAINGIPHRLKRALRS
jgi:ankyrin repeat protein